MNINKEEVEVEDEDSNKRKYLQMLLFESTLYDFI